MNILFITLVDITNLNENGIYTDLINELTIRGHNVSVLSGYENELNTKEHFVSNKTDIYKVNIGQITKTNFIKKGINTLKFETKFINIYKKYLVNEKFDLIIYTTPPVTLSRLIKLIKKKNHAKTYLLLKDISPQNAIDLGILKRSNPITYYFRYKEKKLYGISDFIGAMSQENINYIKKYNNISAKTQIFRNALYEQDYSINESEKLKLIKKLNLDVNKKLFLYGGNLGLPQSPFYINQIIERFDEIKNSQLLIVGNGTYFSFLEEKIKKLNNKNIKILNHLPNEQYKKLISIADVGLIFLDHKFTIPNYPSRLTNFLNAGKPILIACDDNTDIGKEIESWNIGLWNNSNNVDQFIKNANQLISSNRLNEYSENSIKTFFLEFTIQNNVSKLLSIVSTKN